MASFESLTRQHVLAAIDTFDRLGREQFLKTYGYRDSLRFHLRHLRHRGRSYPSKAILGVAAGLRAREFSGGAAHTARVLKRLGFEVRDGERVVTDDLVLQIAKECGFPEEPFRVPRGLPLDPIAYFLSGSNRASEISGLSRVGQDVGVAAPNVHDSSERELAELAGTDINVFVDSGAFSEVEFTADGPVVVRPMGPVEWRRVFGLYRRLAAVLHEQLWVVAPDRVGDQGVTLERLAEYRDELRELDELGARILVPVQRGAQSQAEFAREVARVLGPIHWFPALPCKKSATTPEEARAFLSSFKARHVHFLGLGPTRDEAPLYFQAAKDAGYTVSCDSNWITANVGRGGRKPRLYTAAQDLATQLITPSLVDKREFAFLLAFGVACAVGGA